MNIVIPSANRADRVFVLDYIPPGYNTYLLVPPDQVDEYHRHNPKVEITACPVVGHAGAFRQWAMDYYDDDPHIAMVDDDLKFFYRTDLYNSPHLQNIAYYPDQQRRMWRAIQRSLDHGFPWVGIDYRAGNNQLFLPYRDVIRSFSAWAVNRAALAKLNIRFDAMRVMEDMWVQLNLFTRGLPNRVYCKWIFNQASGFRGGCSTWRTPEIQTEGAHQLQRAFPDFVTIRMVVNKSESWYGKGAERTDVRVQWKRAYESAKNRLHNAKGTATLPL